MRLDTPERSLFLVLTDGIVEATNERGEEFGLERVEKLVIDQAPEPPTIWDAIRTALIAHGPQQDDQSALIVRVL